MSHLRIWPLLVVGALWALPIGCDGCGGHQAYPTHDAAVELPVERGSVSINGDFDDCPKVLTLVTPDTAQVGESIAVSARAADSDGDAGALKLTWTAPSGAFADPAAEHTTFKCASPGPVTITLNVNDGACVTSQSTPVYCMAIPDGGVGGMGGSGTGAGGASGGGAGGMIMNTCPGAEPTSGGAMCPKCTVDNCALGKTGTDGCCGLAAMADQILCQAVVSCMSANADKCSMQGDATSCFCGKSGNDCFMVAGAANGPCVAPVVAAAKSSVPAMIQGQFTSPGSPLGRAVNLIACRGNFCSMECGIP